MQQMPRKRAALHQATLPPPEPDALAWVERPWAGHCGLGIEGGDHECILRRPPAVPQRAWGRRATMTRPGRHVLVAGALAIGLLAGRSDGAASSEQTGSAGTETSSTDEASNAAAPASSNGLAEAKNDQVPSVWVLQAPSGFQTQGPAGPGEAGKWKELLT